VAQRPNEADHDLHCRQCISCEPLREPLHELHFLPPKRSILRMRCRRDMPCFSAKSNTLRFCHVLACMRMRVTRYLFPEPLSRICILPLSRCGVELDSARDQCSRTPQPDIGLDAADVILSPYFVSCQKFLKPEAKEGSSLM
jgi:hypothetical protein